MKKQSLIYKNPKIRILRSFSGLWARETLTAFEEIRVGQPDGFNVTRGLRERLQREDLEQKQTWRSQQLTADTLSRFDRN